MTRVTPKNNWVKVTALFITALFVWETAAWAAPASLSEVVRLEAGVPSGEIEFPNLAGQIRIPSSLGAIKETFSDPRSPAAGLIVHIEDAHGEPEAQKNSQAILDHLKKEYGIQTFFLEGAWSKLEPALLRFSNNAEENQKILSELTEKGIVGGPENFLYENSQNDEQRVAGYGIEDLELYKKNLEQFRAVMGAKAESEAFLHEMKSGLMTKASQVLSPDLAYYFRQWSFQEEVQTDYAAHLRALAEQAQKHLNLDLNDAREQYDWPMLVRFQKLKHLETLAGGRGPEIGAESKRLTKWLEEKSLSVYRDSLFSGPGSPVSGLRESFENFYEKAAPLGFKFKDYPELSKKWGKQILAQELDAPSLIQEIKKLEYKLIERLAQKTDEKKFIAKYREYLLMRKLLNLELSRDEWRGISPEAGGRRLENAESVVGARVSGLGAGIEATIQRARDFYSTAEARDSAMVKRTVDWIKKEGIEKAAIITGGFHSQGLGELLKQNNISYLRIQPRINQIHGRENYLKWTLGEKSSLRAVSPAEPAAPFVFRNALTAEVAAIAPQVADTSSRRSESRFENIVQPDAVKSGGIILDMYQNPAAAAENVRLSQILQRVVEEVMSWGQSEKKKGNRVLYRDLVSRFFYVMRGEISYEGRILTEAEKKKTAAFLTEHFSDLSLMNDFLGNQARQRLLILTARKIFENRQLREQEILKSKAQQNSVAGLERRSFLKLLGLAIPGFSMAGAAAAAPAILSNSAIVDLMGANMIARNANTFIARTKIVAWMHISDRTGQPHRAMMQLIEKTGMFDRILGWLRWNPQYAGYFLTSDYLSEIGRDDLIPQEDENGDRQSFVFLPKINGMVRELADVLWSLPQSAVEYLAEQYRDPTMLQSEQTYLQGEESKGFAKDIAALKKKIATLEEINRKNQFQIEAALRHVTEDSQYGFSNWKKIAKEFPVLKAWNELNKLKQALAGLETLQYYTTLEDQEVSFDSLPGIRAKAGDFSRISAGANNIQVTAYRQWQANQEIRMRPATQRSEARTDENKEKAYSRRDHFELIRKGDMARLVKAAEQSNRIKIRLVGVKGRPLFDDLEYLLLDRVRAEELSAAPLKRKWRTAYLENEDTGEIFPTSFSLLESGDWTYRDFSRSESRVLGMRFDDPRHAKLVYLGVFAGLTDIAISFILRPFLRAYFPEWYPALFNWLPDFLVPLAIGLIYSTQAHLFTPEAIKQENIIVRAFKFIEMKPVLWLLEKLKVEGSERVKRIAFYQSLYIAGLFAFAEIFFPFAHKYLGYESPLPKAYQFGMTFDHIDLLFNGLAAVALFFLNRVGTLRETVQMVKGDVRAIFSFSEKDEAPSSEEITNRSELRRDLTPQEIYDLLKTMTSLFDDDLIRAEDAAQKIAQLPVQKVLVVGTGLKFLPDFLYLMGKEVVFVDASPLQLRDRAVLRALRARYFEKKGVAPPNYPEILSEIGELDLQKNGLEPNSFDLVTMADLSMVPVGDPLQWLLKAKELLRKDQAYLLGDMQDLRYHGMTPAIGQNISTVFPNRRVLFDGEYFRGDHDGFSSHNQFFEVQNNRSEARSAPKFKNLVGNGKGLGFLPFLRTWEFFYRGFKAWTVFRKKPWPIQIEGYENLWLDNPDGRLILAGNHTGLAENLFFVTELYRLSGRMPFFIAQPEHVDSITRTLIKMGGGLPIEKGKTVAKAEEFLRNNPGAILGIFPAGRPERVHERIKTAAVSGESDDAIARDFLHWNESAAAKIAVETGAAVVPFAIDSNVPRKWGAKELWRAFRLWQKNDPRQPPFYIRVRIGKPISSKGQAAEALMSSLKLAVVGELRKATEEAKFNPALWLDGYLRKFPEVLAAQPASKKWSDFKVVEFFHSQMLKNFSHEPNWAARFVDVTALKSSWFQKLSPEHQKLIRLYRTYLKLHHDDLNYFESLFNAAVSRRHFISLLSGVFVTATASGLTQMPLVASQQAVPVSFYRGLGGMARTIAAEQSRAIGFGHSTVFEWATEHLGLNDAFERWGRQNSSLMEQLWSMVRKEEKRIADNDVLVQARVYEILSSVLSGSDRGRSYAVMELPAYERLRGRIFESAESLLERLNHGVEIFKSLSPQARRGIMLQLGKSPSVGPGVNAAEAQRQRINKTKKELEQKLEKKQAHFYSLIDSVARYVFESANPDATIRIKLEKAIADYESEIIKPKKQIDGELRDLADQEASLEVSQKILAQIQPYLHAYRERTLFASRSEAREGLTRRAWFTLAAGFIGATTFVKAQPPVSAVKAQLFNPTEVNKESLELKKFISGQIDALLSEWAVSEDKEQQNRVQFIQSVLPTFQKNLWFYSPKNAGAVSTSGAVTLRFGGNRLHEIDSETGKPAFQIEFSYDFAKAVQELILRGNDEVKHFARHALLGGIFMKEMMSLKPMIEHPEYFEILAAAQTRFNNPISAELKEDGRIEMTPEELSKDEKEFLITTIGYFNLLFEAEGYVGELDYLTALYLPMQFIANQKKMMQLLQSPEKAGSVWSSHFKERGAPAIFDFLRSRTNRFVEDKKFAEKWSARSHAEKIKVEALRHILAVQQGKGQSLGVTFTQWRVYDALMRRQMDVAWDKKMDFLGSTPEELGLPKSVDELNQKIQVFHGRSEMRAWNAAEARRFYDAAVQLQRLMKKYAPLFKAKQDSADWWKEEGGDFVSDDAAVEEKPQPEGAPSSRRSGDDESLNRKKFRYFSHLEKAINGFLNVTVKTFNPAQSSHGWEGYDQGPRGVSPWRFQPAMQRMGRFAGSEWSKNVDALFDAYQTRNEGTINDMVKGLVILYPRSDKYLGQLPEDLKQLRTTILTELSGAQDEAMLANETKPEQILNRVQEDLGSIGSPLAEEFAKHLRTNKGKVLIHDPINNVNYPLFEEDEFGLLKYYPHSAIAWFERESLISEPREELHLKELNQYAANFRDWIDRQKQISDYERALLNKAMDAVTFLSVPRYAGDVSAESKFGMLFKENPWRPTIKNILDKAPDAKKFYSLLSGLLPFYLGLSKPDQRYEPLETMQIGMLADLIGVAPEAAKVSWERSGLSKGPWDIHFEKEFRAEMDFSKGDQLISDLLQALELKDKKININIPGFGPQTLYDLSVDGKADLNRDAFDVFVIVWGQIQSRSEMRSETLNPYLSASFQLLEEGDRKMGLSAEQTKRFKDPRNIFIKRHEFKLGDNEKKSFVVSRVRHFHPQDGSDKDLPVRGGLRVLMPSMLGKVFDEKLSEIQFTGDDNYDLYLRNQFLDRWIQEYAHAMAIQMTLKNLLWGLPRGGAKGVIFLGAWKKVDGDWKLVPTIEKKDDLNSISRVFREVSKVFLVNNVIHESVDGAAPDVNPFTGVVETDRVMEWMVDSTIRVLAQSDKVELVDAKTGEVNVSASTEMQLRLEAIAELDITQTPYLESAILFLQKNPGLAWPVLGRYTGKSVLRGGSQYRKESTGEAAVVVAQEVLRHELKVAEDQNPLAGKTAAVQGFGAVGIYSVLRLVQQGAHVTLLSDHGGAIRSKSKSGFTIDEITEMVDLVRRKQSIIQFAELHPENAETLQKEEAGGDTAKLRDLGNATLLQASVDLLFLAALNGQIHPKNADLIRAKYVVDIANGGVTPDAAAQLAQKNILVAPSILASGGGTAISHQEVLQNEANDYFEMDAVRERMETDIRDFMRAIYSVIKVERAQGRSMDLNEASYAVARQKTLAPLKAQPIRSEMRVFNGYDGVADEVVRVAREKQSRKKGTGVLLGLGGPSGVGKGFFSKIISGALTRQGYDVHSLEIDGFLKLDAEEVKLQQRAAAQGQIHDTEWDFWDEDAAFDAMWLVHDFLNMSFEQPTHPLLLDKIKTVGNPDDIDSIEIVIPQAWHRTQKDGSNRYEDKWVLHRDSVVILDGKYIARFEKKFRESKGKRLSDALLVLEDDGDATREKYVHRVYEKYAHQLRTMSRLLEEKLNIFDYALVPSYQRYEKETKDVWDYLINVRGLYRPEISEDYPQPIFFEDQDVVNPEKLEESVAADLRIFSDFVLGLYPEHYQRVKKVINERRLLAKVGYEKLPTAAQVMGEILAELHMAMRDHSANPLKLQSLFRFNTPTTINFPDLKAAMSVYLEGRVMPVRELERILEKKDDEQRGQMDRNLMYQLLIAPKLMQYLMYLAQSTKELKTFAYYRDRAVNAWSNLEREALAALKADGFEMSGDFVGLAYKEKLIQNALNVVLGNYSSVQYHDGEPAARSEMRMPKAGRDSLPALRFFYREILRLHLEMTRASYRPAEEDDQKQAVYDAVVVDLKELQRLLQGHPRIRGQLASRIKSALNMLAERGTKRNPVAAGTALTQAVEDILNKLYEPRIKKQGRRHRDSLASRKIVHLKDGTWILKQGVYRNVKVGKRGSVAMTQKQDKQFSSLWELARSLDHQLEKMTLELTQARETLVVLNDIQDFLEHSAGELPPDLSARLGKTLKTMQAQWVIEKQLAAQALQFAVELEHQEVRSRVARFAEYASWLIKTRSDELEGMIASVQRLREKDLKNEVISRNYYFARSLRSLKVTLERYFGTTGFTWRSAREPRPVQAKIAGIIRDLEQVREPDYEGILALLRGIQSGFGQSLKASSPEGEARLLRYVEAALGLVEFSDVRHNALFEFEKRKREIGSKSEEMDEDVIFRTVFQDLINQRKLNNRAQWPSAWFDLYAFAREPIHLTVQKERVSNPRFEALRVLSQILGAKSLQDALNRKKVKAVEGLAAKIKELGGSDLNQSVLNLPGESRKQLFEFIQTAFQLEKKLPLLPAQYRARSEMRNEKLDPASQSLSSEARKEGPSKVDFFDFLGAELGDKEIRLLDAGTGEGSFVESFEKLAAERNRSVKITAIDFLPSSYWGVKSSQAEWIDGDFREHAKQRSEYYDLITLNAPDVIADEMVQLTNALAPGGVMVIRKSKKDSLYYSIMSKLERDKLESAGLKILFDREVEFEALPSGSAVFERLYAPMIVKKGEFASWTKEKFSRSETRVNKTQPVANHDRTAVAEANQNIFAVEFVAAMSRSEFRSFYDRFFPEMAALRQKNMREIALRKAGLALQVDEGLIVGADLTAREGFWDAAKLLFTGQKVAVLGAGVSPLSNIRFFNDVPAAKKWLNAKKITAWVSPDEAVEHAELKREVSDWVIMTNQRLAKLYSALGLEAFAQKLMISREFLRAA